MTAGLILVAVLLLAAGAISIELGISVAILEILIGVFAANQLELGDITWMEFLSTLGLVGIMFFAGFETDQKLLKQYWKRSLVIGLSSYFVPFFLVFLLSFYYLDLGVMPSLLLSIGLSTTSLALVYAVMVEKNKLSSEAGQIILSSAMVVDVLSMVSLMVVFEGVHLQTLISLFGFMVALIYFPRIGKWFFNRYHKGNVEFQSRFILVVLLSLILVAQIIELHLAIVAFITGFMLSEIIKENHQLETNLKSVIFGFMAPLFFFKAGLSIDLSEVSTETLKLALLLGSVAFIGKFWATSFVFNRFFKKTIGRFAGLVFNYRLSFGIIIASFGLSHGLISQDVYIGILTIVVSTSVVSTLAMKYRSVPELAAVPKDILTQSVNLGKFGFEVTKEVTKEVGRIGQKSLEVTKDMGKGVGKISKKGLEASRELGKKSLDFGKKGLGFGKKGFLGQKEDEDEK